MNPYEFPKSEADSADRATNPQRSDSADRSESSEPGKGPEPDRADSSYKPSRTFSVSETAANAAITQPDNRDRTSPSALVSPETQHLMNQLLRDGLKDMEQRRNALRLEVEQLERRRDRIQTEMRQSFAGVSQDLAVRVQGFKDYLVGSLQDLAIAAEQLELAPPQPAPQPAPPSPTPSRPPAPVAETEDIQPRFTDERFQRQIRRIRALLDQYRTRPEYYGPAWQLRRTFEPIHAERVSNWFFKQGGRGAIRSMGSRLQNVLVTSAVISILKDLYQERLGVLILTDTPERLGEWRRGLQDCLGIARMDFNVEQGVVLFEAPEPLAQRAERMTERGMLPLIIVDEAEGKIDLSILQFPLWLAFAPNPAPLSGRPPERDRTPERYPDRFGNRF